MRKNEWDNLPIIDWELGHRLAGNQKDLAKDMLGMLIDNLPQNISVIHQLHIEHNYTGLKQQIHKLHGAVVYCGTPRLKSILAQLNTFLKNCIQHEIDYLIEQLKTEVKTLLNEWKINHNN